MQLHCESETTARARLLRKAFKWQVSVSDKCLWARWAHSRSACAPCRAASAARATACGCWKRPCQLQAPQIHRRPLCPPAAPYAHSCVCAQVRMMSRLSGWDVRSCWSGGDDSAARWQPSRSSVCHFRPMGPSTSLHDQCGMKCARPFDSHSPRRGGGAVLSLGPPPRRRGPIERRRTSEQATKFSRSIYRLGPHLLIVEHHSNYYV
eukprot:SAG31_NODE_2324_length_5941_cov_1.960801_6_plen_207_part_00